MNILKDFKLLTKFELGLWITSIIVVTLSFLLSSPPDYLTLLASLTGVSALIFLAKGFVSGQILVIIFSVFYGIISVYYRYYGEMITYLCMTTPMAVLSLISWIKHPFEKSNEVEVNHLTKKQIGILLVLTAVVTVAFYFILGALNTTNLIVSTISVSTSFFAASLTYLRSPYYAIGYSLNDIVLIVLWVLASIKSLSYLPMVFCFLMFLVNDLYGFYNWRKMQKRQSQNKNKS